MTTYYVATNGNDSSNGSTTTPWRTISKAMWADLNPGDEIVVRPGTYNEAVNITQDGSAAGYITLRSEVPGEAEIRPPSSAWNAISVNANYIVIDGFDIGGARGDGIEANNVHHIRVLNNISHDNAESGIQFNWSEFITIDGNETYNNASSGWFSGISIYQNRNITGDTTTEGFRTIVRNNISHDNVTESGQHTDGNGIIIDDFQSTQTNGYPNYIFPTLVENNLVYSNGGKGVQVAWSDYVTVRNNTAWHNNVDQANTGTWRGELSNAQSSNNTWINNIAIADQSINSNNTAIDNTSYGGYSNKTIIWQNNITFNGTSGQASVKTDGGNAAPSAANGNLLGVDPKFVNAAADNFHLQPGSPAINAGTDRFGLAPDDLDGGARAVGIVDIGAYEVTTLGSNQAPTITSNGGGVSASVSIRENTTAVATVVATDLDSANITYSISGGADAAKFTINTTTGALAFVAAPNFENPTDAGRNNVYDVQVRASDGSRSDTQGIAVTVTNQNEAAPFSDAADTVTLPSRGGTFDALGGDDKLFYTGGQVSIDGGAGSDTIDFSQFDSAVRVLLIYNDSEHPDMWALDSGSLIAIGNLSSVENIVGTEYADILKGNREDNVIKGADGNDTLEGYRGNDTFVFGLAFGRDTIRDFTDQGHDVIVVSTAVFADFAALQEALIDVGRDVLIALDAENSITLTDTSFASITESDFLFV